MAGTGCSMMTKIKIYAAMQYSMKGPSNTFPFKQKPGWEEMRDKHSIKEESAKTDRRKWRGGLTVLVARLSEGFSFGENDGNSQILKRRDVEEAGVLVVPDVFGVVCARCVLALRETGGGHITGATGQKGNPH